MCATKRLDVIGRKVADGRRNTGLHLRVLPVPFYADKPSGKVRSVNGLRRYVGIKRLSA